MSTKLDPFRRQLAGRTPWGATHFRDRPFLTRSLGHAPAITGVSRDNTGAALGACVVKCYRAWDDLMIAQTVSDGSGNFTLNPSTSGPYYLVWYLAGSPDRAGTSVNTLVAT
jgi:hypothetical protein